MVITLIGYRGSGKSTVAAGLAARLGCDWTDADSVIEQAAGKTIREIFESEGEPGFRRREREAIAGLLQRDKLVLAAGGGAILNADTRREMQAAGPVVWLQASAGVLAGRIAADPATAARRPNLAGGGLDEITRLLAEREPLYRECAKLSIFTDQLAVPEIVERIAVAVAARHSRGGGR
ncbi:MAG: shikimate kinase [Planctomycetia bacterium]|nr:shikimate kinase [Planctomycetia bacterium]